VDWSTSIQKEPADRRNIKFVTGSLNFDQGEHRLTCSWKGHQELEIPFSSTAHITHERTGTPRYAHGLLLAWPLLFTKSKTHYLTIQYQEDGVGNTALFRISRRLCDKSSQIRKCQPVRESSV
jgi:hypothetical protein